MGGDWAGKVSWIVTVCPGSCGCVAVVGRAAGIAAGSGSVVVVSGGVTELDAAGRAAFSTMICCAPVTAAAAVWGVEDAAGAVAVMASSRRVTAVAAVAAEALVATVASV